MNVQELATKYLKHFKQKKRDNGETFYCLDGRAPQALKDLVQSAHDRMFPDDFRYSFIHDALIMFSEQEDVEDAISNIEPDCYTSDLLRWVSSHHNRIGYVDEQASELGHSEQGLVGDMMQGQVYERAEIANSVLSSLRDIVEDIAA